MCGFIGLLSKSDKKEAFYQGVAAIQARGTSLDTYEDEGEQYGYCRLPTDDVANNELGRISRGAEKLLFNGLITNVGYLAHMFNLPEQAKKSDTYCLQAGLSAHGAGFLGYARGMFALAFVTEETVTLARDTVGIKPLYYAFSEGTFAFASELKALIPLSATVYEVKPGQIVIYDKKSRTLRKQSYRYISYKHYKPGDLEECLYEAVVKPTERYLTNSDKKVALLLSGGLDSSVLAALLTRSLSPALKSRLVAFCIGNEDAPDVRTAVRLAGILRLKLMRVSLYTPEESLQRLPRIVYETESPHARVAKVALLYEALAAAIKRQGIDVVIGGEGADELFFGYHRFIDGLTHEQSEELFGIFFQEVFRHTLLQRYDRIMARQQIEGRVPYLDQELVELSLRMPAAAKVRYHKYGHTSKLPLRALAKRLGLPPYIHSRTKIKMTAGATNKPNDSTEHGYLEQEAETLTGLGFQQLTQTLYRLQFGNVFSVGNHSYTEESTMQLAARFRAANQSKYHERSYA